MSLLVQGGLVQLRISDIPVHLVDSSLSFDDRQFYVIPVDLEALFSHRTSVSFFGTLPCSIIVGISDSSGVGT